MNDTDIGAKCALEPLFTPRAVPEDITSLLGVLRDPAHARAAVMVVGALRDWSLRLRPADLLRRVDGDDGLAWLEAVAATTRASTNFLAEERKVADALLTARRASVSRLDSEAMTMFVQANEAITRATSAIESDAAVGEGEYRNALVNGGATAEEVEDALQRRRARIGMPDKHRALAEATERRDRLTSFLRNDDRDTALLGDALLAELEERTRVRQQIAAEGGVSWASESEGGEA